MRTALYIAAVITVATASPNGYYHQAYNYKTSASSYKNNELQHKTDDQGFYSRQGDLEGRLKPKVSSNSEHSEYVNPKLSEQGGAAGYYDAGTDFMSQGNMLANTYGASVGGQVSSGYQSGYQSGSQYDGMASSDNIGGSSRYTGTYNAGSEATYGSSNLRSIASNLQNDLQREIQSALISEAHRTDIAQLESELHRNLTERLNQILQERYGTQTIKGGQSYSLSGGRLETRPNYEQQDLEQLQRQIERGLLEQLRQGYGYRSSQSSQQTINERYQVTTTYRPTTYRSIYPNLNVINSQDKYSYGQTKNTQYSSMDYTQVPNVISITTIASNVQRDLNEQLNRLLEQAQQQYFENSRSTVNTGAILERLKQELRQNVTYALDQELQRNFGTQFQRNGYMFSTSRGAETINQYNYNIADLENLKRQVEDNLITKLSRDFETARQHSITRQQQQQRSDQTYYSQGQASDYTIGGSSNNLRYEYSTPRYTGEDYYRPTSASIVPLISSGVKGNQYQSSGSHLSTYEASGSSNVAQLQRQLQADLSNQLQAAISQNGAYMNRYSSSGGQGQASFDEAYRRLYEELQRNLTQQLQSFQAGGSAYSSSYGGVSENQLAQLRSQLQSSLASQLQQGLQQSYSASASYSASSGSSAAAGAGSYSSSNTGGYYRAARGSDNNYQYGQYRAERGYSIDDCQEDDPQAYHRSKRSYGYGYRSQPLGLATNTGAGYNSRGTYGGHSSYGGYSTYGQGQEEDDTDTEPIGQEIDDGDTQQIEVDNSFISGQGHSERQMSVGQQEDDSDDTQQHQISHGFGSISLGSQSLQTGSQISRKPITQSNQRGDIIPQSTSVVHNPIGQEVDDADDTQQIEDSGFSSYSRPTTFQRQPITGGNQYGQTAHSYGSRNQNSYNYYKPTYGQSSYGGYSSSYGSIGPVQGQEEDDTDDTQQPEIDNSFGLNLNHESVSDKPTPVAPVVNVLPAVGPTQSPIQPAIIPAKLTQISLQLEESLNAEIENIVKNMLPISLAPNQLYTDTFYNLQANITQQCENLLTDKRYSYLNLQQQEIASLRKYIEAHLVEKLDKQFKTSTYFTYHPLPPKPYNYVVRRPYGQQNFGVASNTFLQGEINSQGNPYVNRPNQHNNLRPVQFGQQPSLINPIESDSSIGTSVSVYPQQDDGRTPKVDNSMLQTAEDEADLLFESLSKSLQARNRTKVEETSNPTRPIRPDTNTLYNNFRPQYPLNPGRNNLRPDNSQGQPTDAQADILITGLSKTPQLTDNTEVEETSNPNEPIRPGVNTVNNNQPTNFRPQSPSNVGNNNLRPDNSQGQQVFNIEQTRPTNKPTGLNPEDEADLLLESLSPQINPNFDKNYNPNRPINPSTNTLFNNQPTVRPQYPERNNLRPGNQRQPISDDVIDNIEPTNPNRPITPSTNSLFNNQPAVRPQYPQSNNLGPGNQRQPISDVIDNIEPINPTVPALSNFQPQVIKVKLENITTDQLKAINQIIGDLSDSVDATVQNVYIPTSLNEYSKNQHYQQSVRKLEEEFRKKLRDSMNGGSPGFTSITENFEPSRISDVQKYIEIKVIKRIREQLKKLYNIKVTENTYRFPTFPTTRKPVSTSRKPIYNTVERVVRLENITPGQKNVIDRIQGDFSNIIDTAVQTEYDSNKYSGYSNYELYRRSLQKLEEEIKRNLTEIIEGKTTPNLENPTFKLYTTLINQQFESTKIPDLLQYLEIKLIKQVRTQLRKVYNIEVTEDSYEVVQSSGPQSSLRPGSQIRKPTPQNGVSDEKVVRLENITPEQLNIINDIQEDFEEVIKLAIQDEHNARVSSSSPSYSNYDLYKISLRKIEQEIKQNLSDIIESGTTQNPTLQLYINSIRQKFPQAKRSDLLQYLEIKLIKQVRVQLKKVYNIETTEESYEVIESSGPQESHPSTIFKPTSRQEKVVRLENITPEQQNIINDIQDDFSDVINVAVQTEYDSNSFSQYSKYQLYVRALKKLEEEIKKNLTEIINGNPYQSLQNPNLKSYSTLINQKFEPTKIPDLLQYLEIKLIQKIRAQLRKAYNIQITEDSYEVQEISGPQESSRRRVVRLENITPAQFQVIKKIENDIDTEIQNTLLLRMKTLKASSVSSFSYQQALEDLETELKNKIAESVHKLFEPGMSPYSELVSVQFDHGKFKSLERYLEIRLVNKLRETIILNSSDSQTSFHYSSGSVRYSHGYSNYQSTGLNKQLDSDAEIVPSQQTNLNLPPAAGHINGDSEVELLGPENVEPTTETGNWWSRFKTKVSKGATNLKSKITGNS